MDQTEVIGVSDDDYVSYDDKAEQKIANVIKSMKIKDARRIGLSKMQMFRLKKKVKVGKQIVLKKKTLHKLNTVRI